MIGLALIRAGSDGQVLVPCNGEDEAHLVYQFALPPLVLHSFVAGQLKYLRELTLLLAPNINSYKRFVEGSFAPTAVAWGRDNRTCALRVVGHGPLREPLEALVWALEHGESALAERIAAWGRLPSDPAP
mgnify:CR=1 FL=1